MLGVAAAARFAGDGTVEEARIVLGAVSSKPVVTNAGDALVGRRLDDDAIAEAAAKAAVVAKPVDNADFTLSWRKKMVAAFVGYALRELRGDDMRVTRLRVARHALDERFTREFLPYGEKRRTARAATAAVFWELNWTGPMQTRPPKGEATQERS